MSKLQRTALAALDELGPMTSHELAVACICNVQYRAGGFANTVISLFRNGWVESYGFQIKLTRKGIDKLGTEIDPTSFAAVDQRL